MVVEKKSDHQWKCNQFVQLQPRGEHKRTILNFAIAQLNGVGMFKKKSTVLDNRDFVVTYQTFIRFELIFYFFLLNYHHFCAKLQVRS